MRDLDALRAAVQTVDAKACIYEPEEYPGMFALRSGMLNIEVWMPRRQGMYPRLSASLVKRPSDFALLRAVLDWLDGEPGT